MAAKVALVIGPTGATGGPLAAALARRKDWRVYGMSRNAPLDGVPFTHLAADLADPASCRQALASIEPVTHAFFAARAPFREGGVEDVEANVAMLAATLDALETRSDALAHVHLLEGTKWYGMHLGPYPTPSREDDPRHLPPNFYYDQQDLLSARAGTGGLELVGLAAVLYLRLRTSAGAKPDHGARHLCGDLPGTPSAA